MNPVTRAIRDYKHANPDVNWDHHVVLLSKDYRAVGHRAKTEQDYDDSCPCCGENLQERLARMGIPLDEVESHTAVIELR